MVFVTKCKKIHHSTNVELVIHLNSFNLVSFVAAYEHFLNVLAVIREISRVLCKGVIVWNEIHQFSSLSWGHNVNLMEISLRILPNGIKTLGSPSKKVIPIQVPLNEFRIHQYIKEFSRRFDQIEHYCTMREGEHLLSPEIQSELSDYSREEFTCGFYFIVARKV